MVNNNTKSMNTKIFNTINAIENVVANVGRLGIAALTIIGIYASITMHANTHKNTRVFLRFFMRCFGEYVLRIALYQKP